MCRVEVVRIIQKIMERIAAVENVPMYADARRLVFKVFLPLPYNPSWDGSGSILCRNTGTVMWFSLAAAFAISALAGFWAVRRQQAALVFVSGLLLNVAGALVWWYWPSAAVNELWGIQILCLALGSAIWTLIDAVHPGRVRHVELGRRRWVFAHLAIQAAVALLTFRVACRLTGAMLDRPPMALGPLDWSALLAASLAAMLFLRDRAAAFSPTGLYVLGLTSLGMGEVQRGFAPAQFFLWGVACDLAGFVLVAALLGWVLPRLRPIAVKLRIPAPLGRHSADWFHSLQALLALAVAGLTVYIAIDFSFDNMGKGVALFGLAGRWAACPAALMLVGTTILMAWQSRGRWRAGWQYGAMVAGMLFTSSLGWAALAATTPAPWHHRSVNLLVSASMMTLLTSVGLARVLPGQSDWIQRGRWAMPAFGGLALSLLAIVIAQRLL